MDEGIVHAFNKEAFMGRLYDFIELESGKPTMDELYSALQVADDGCIISITIQNQYIRKAKIEPTQTRIFATTTPTFNHNPVELTIQSFYSTLDKVVGDLSGIAIEPLIINVDQAFLSIYFRVHRNCESLAADKGENPNADERKTEENRALVGKWSKYIAGCLDCPFYETVILEKNAPLQKSTFKACKCPECGGQTTLRRLPSSRRAFRRCSYYTVEHRSRAGRHRQELVASYDQS